MEKETRKQRTERLTAALLAERRQQQETASRHQSARCFMCRRSFLFKRTDGDDSPMFCSVMCRITFDAGGRPAERERVASEKLIVVAGPPGIEIGSSYYDSIRQHVKEKNKSRYKIPNEELARPPRLCERCGSRIPPWTKGKKTPSTRRFCGRC